MRKLQRAFTLIEITVGIAVFALAMTGISGILMAVQSGWQQQKVDLDLVQNCRWAEEFISNEIREAGNLNLVSAERISFDLDTNQDDAPDAKVWYWRGNTNFDTSGLGNRSYLYRGVGNNINQAYLNRQQLADFIINNPSGNSIFQLSGNLLTVEISSSKDKRRYILRTAARARN